jgi:hypothetical protein
MELRVGATRGMQATHQLNFEGAGQALRHHLGCGLGRHRGHTRRSTTICWARDRPNQRALVVACRGLGPPMDLRDPSWTRAMDRVLLETCSTARRFRCALLQGTVAQRVGWQGLQQRPTSPIYRSVLGPIRGTLPSSLIPPCANSFDRATRRRFQRPVHLLPIPSDNQPGKRGLAPANQRSASERWPLS